MTSYLLGVIICQTEFAVCNMFFQIPFTLEQPPSIISKSILEGGAQLRRVLIPKLIANRKDIDKNDFTIKD